MASTVLKKEKLYIFYSIFKSVANIDFWQIWQFDTKGTGSVGLLLSIILLLTVGRFDT